MLHSESVIERTARLFHEHHERMITKRWSGKGGYTPLPWEHLPDSRKSLLQDTVASMLDDRSCPLIPAIRA